MRWILWIWFLITIWTHADFSVFWCWLPSNLEILLHANKITDINLKDVENLRKVSLLNHSLTSLSAEMFPQDSVLTQVSFRNNQIKAIDRNFIKMFENPNFSAYANNSCVIMDQAKKYKLDQCFKNFEREKASKRLIIMDN
jgi:Leucine-rich repeat (LRR) protein